MSRKDKKSIKKRTAEAQQLQNIEDIGDIGDFDAIAALDNYSPYNTTGTAGGSGGGGYDGDVGGVGSGEKGSKSSSKKVGKDSATQSLQLAVKAFASSAKIGGSKRTVNTAITYNDDDMRDDPSTATHINTAKKSRTGTNEGQNYDPYGDDNDDDDAYMQVENTNTTHARRRAPSGPMSTTTDNYNSDDDNGHNSDPHTSNNSTSNILDEFIKKKKDYLKKKKEHYTVEPIYSGIDDHLTTPSFSTSTTATTTTDNSKRGITYEILKNKGVTPYRKLINRNPRVKKRKAYEKAIISRKGQVREVITGVAGAYGGELTGIKSGLARSRKF